MHPPTLHSTSHPSLNARFSKNLPRRSLAIPAKLFLLPCRLTFHAWWPTFGTLCVGIHRQPGRSGFVSYRSLSLLLALLPLLPSTGRLVRFFAGAILHHEEMSSEVDNVAVNYTVRQPLGVCALISPWNLPLYLLSWKIAPAIAVGNTVVCKPSELTPVTAYLLAKVINEAGIPPGVVNIVNGVRPSLC